MEFFDDPNEETPPGGWAPDPPDLEWAVEKLRNKDWANELEHLELLGAIMFSSDEEADEFVEWVHRQRRECQA
jgi:hypothetical protein